MSYPQSAPRHIDLATLGAPTYLGSVQHIYSVPDHPGYMICRTTEAGSVFDVGSIFNIEGNDLNRAVFRHAMYGRLADPATWARVKNAITADTTLPDDWRAELLKGPLEKFVETGAVTHHLGMVDAKTGDVATHGLPENPSTSNVVRRFPVMHPPRRPLLGSFVFDYAQFHQSDCYVIPLEYIVRFGVTSGSSILKKYEGMSGSARSAYEQELGLTRPMQAWEMLSPPIFDLTSKYEPEDRNVTKQEALLMSGLSTQAFQDTVKMALLGGWAVRELLEQIGLSLWDLKWEFAVDHEELLFVDTIDSDSFRATSTLETDGHQLIIHYNKQAMRDYYRIVHPDWYSGINAAKAEAQRIGRPFKEVLQEGQATGRFPATPEVDPHFLALQGRKTSLIRQHVEGSSDSATLRNALAQCGHEEVAFYRQRGHLDALAALNAVQA